MYSVQKAKERALAYKIYKNRKQAKDQHPDVKRIHPDWCRDAGAERPNYTLIDKATKDEFNKNLKIITERRQKRGYET